MEQSTHSDDQLIKLGKKIVKDLEIHGTSDTLAKWMSHYLAELINGINESQDVEENEFKKKECFETILKLWDHRYKSSFIESPVDNFGDLLEILESVRERKSNRWSSSWPSFDLPRNNSWAGFIKIASQRFENILELSLLIGSNEYLISHSTEWDKEFDTILSDDEKKLLDRVGFLLNKGVNFWDRIESGQEPSNMKSKKLDLPKIKGKIREEIENLLKDLEKVDK
ncbi:hypothetical protein [Jiulongibacter sediminis]|uniref:hypothetical protein n=1 Tax=Jiulongibacter sediminis TaxID=1605367 RepID=UPI0006DC0B65|nr:hypothetical protein [Jiulongibacter sediminis]